ncbi:Lactate utilization protein B/C [Methanobacterium lacus]|uniref:Lactate utilization protein B/C n=1 Tax=Methanobacterium lacus (strain AL-21) TaxID=877455 RepID=F0TC74_METLA|nr:LUD domain-containing protein [Methanobacterium lacus]ADZ09225.1 Lactate utilization protein B/C [Methanobacterium lacus]
MKQSEIKAMNRSFGILDGRKSNILHSKRTEELKERVNQIRKFSIDNMEELVSRGIEKLEENGVEVVTADKPEDALEAIYSIVHDQSIVAKSKSNTAGEIGLTEFLEFKGVSVIETDLGDRIVQLDPNSRPSHPIGPASHLRMDDIAVILSNHYGVDVEPEPRTILNTVKDDVVKNISKCSVGITGANSVAADDGSIVTVHNEGNISLVSMLDTHIILVGIDKFVETIEDAVSVVKLETIYASGKTVPAYMNIISSPSKTADIEQILLKNMYGSRRVVVVLLDNGRRKAVEEGGECLLCIGCGSCIVTCPIYNVVGNDFGYRRHLGGRGVVLSSFIDDEKTCKDSGLYLCTMCGQCTYECPVGVKTSELIKKLRNDAVIMGLACDEHRIIRENIKKKGSPF